MIAKEQQNAFKKASEYFTNLKQNPSGHALSYFFLYFVVALINFYHVLLFEIPKEGGSSGSGNAVSVSAGMGTKSSGRDSRAEELQEEQL